LIEIDYGAYGGGGNYASPSNFAPSPMGGGAQGGFMMSDSPASQKVYFVSTQNDNVEKLHLPTINRS
tara:strand:+ start:168 stop:368 length:201 start_codon:yes stop_codon:yes gene_type:complete